MDWFHFGFINEGWGSIDNTSAVNICGNLSKLFIKFFFNKDSYVSAAYMFYRLKLCSSRQSAGG